jgi:hypothetical protein
MLIPWISVLWLEFEDSFQDLFLIVFAGIPAVTLVLTMIGIISADRERWLAFTLASVLFFGFSIGYIYSLGFILAPIGFVLLSVSIWRLGTI